MSNIPTQPAEAGAGGAPDPDVQDLAAKHGISVAEAERLIREHGVDRGKADAAAERGKTENTGG